MTLETEYFSNLNIEFQKDGSVIFGQEASGDVERVWVHPIQLRYAAEKMGLVDASDPQAAKTIATLERRLLLLRNRIDNLHSHLVKHSDLSFEATYAKATLDVANEFCHDLVEQAEPCKPRPAASVAATGPSSEPGESMASNQQSIDF